MPAPIGHNSETVLNATAQGQLKSILERVERIEDDEIGPAREALKEVYAEAKGNGFDVKILRRIAALRKKDRAKVMEENAILALYAHALGCDDLV